MLRQSPVLCEFDLPCAGIVVGTNRDDLRGFHRLIGGIEIDVNLSARSRCEILVGR